MIRSSLNELQFQLRKNILGKLRLRTHLPDLKLPTIPSLEEQFYLHVLKTFLNREDREPSSESPRWIIDVGCRNWSYSRAIAQTFPKAQLLGLELDGNRRYWNLHRRIDVAQAYALALSHQGHLAQAKTIDFRDLQALPSSQNGLITFFFPFVSVSPCLKWGLPSRFSTFSGLLNHAKRLAQSSQTPLTCLSLHQGAWEAQEAHQAYAQIGHPTHSSTILIPAREIAPFWPAGYDHYLMSCRF